MQDIDKHKQPAAVRGAAVRSAADREVRVLLAGYFGHDNIGDEIILAGMLSDLRDRIPRLRCTVLSGSPEKTRQLHDVDALLFTDLESVREEISHSDLVLIGGGGILFDAYNNTYLPERILDGNYFGFSYYATVLTLSTLYQVPCMFYAVGIGPVISKETHNLMVSMVDLCSGITVRDQNSRDILVPLLAGRAGLEKKILVASDPAFSIDPKTDSPNGLIEIGSCAKGRKRLGVSLRYWDFGQSQAEWEKETAAALDRLVSEDNYCIVFLPFQANTGTIHEDDFQVCDRVRSLMSNQSETMLHQQKLSYQQCISLLKGCSAVLGMRYHSILLALKEGIPVVGMEYDLKVRSIMEEYGLSDHLLAQPWTRRTITPAVRSLVVPEDPISWENKTAELKTRAHLSADLAAELLVGSQKKDKPGERLLREILLQKVSALLDAKELLQRFPLLETERSELAASLSRKDTELEQLQIHLARTSAEKEELSSEVIKKAREISALSIESDQKSAQIARISSDLEDSNYQQSVLSTTVVEMKAALSAAEEEMRRLQTETGALHERISRMKDDLSRAGNELQEIHSSRYWKVLGYYWRAAGRIRKLIHPVRK